MNIDNVSTGSNLARLQALRQQLVPANDTTSKYLIEAVGGLLDHNMHLDHRLSKVERSLNFVSAMQGRIEEVETTNREMKEALRRVNFLWASQGLGEFALDKFAAGVGQTQLPSHSRKTPVATPEPVGSTSLSDSHDAANLVLQQSLNVRKMLEERRGPGSSISDAHGRLQSVENVVDGVLGINRQLHTQVSKLAESVARTERFSLSLESRISVLNDLINRLAEQETLFKDQIARQVEQIQKKCSQLTEQGAQNTAMTEQVRERCEVACRLVAEVRSTMPEFETVKAVAAREAQMILSRHNVSSPKKKSTELTTSNLATLFDIDVNEAAKCLSDLPEETSQQEEKRRRRMLELIHSGLPFRSVLGALHRVHFSLQKVEERLDRMTKEDRLLGQPSQPAARHACQPVSPTSPAPPKPMPPTLGLELRDPTPHTTEAGPIVVRTLPSPSPAAVAGLVPQDIILSVGEQRVRSRNDFSSAIQTARSVGSTSVQLEVRSFGEPNFHYTELSLY